MAEYYRNPYGSRGHDSSRRRSFWMILADTFMWVLTVTAVIAMTIIFAGRFISPERMWYFSLLGLVAPVVYITVVLTMLYWIVRWRWSAVLLAGIFVMLGLFHMPMYYKLDLTKQYGEPAYDRSSIKVLTFNVRYMQSDTRKSTIDSVTRLVRSLNPDIVCFQEFPLDRDVRRRIASKMVGYNAAGTDSRQMECFTKFPIGPSREIEGFGERATCFCTDIYINDDTVRVYNAHLQTTSVTSDDKDYISNVQFISDSTREKRFIHIARGLKANNTARAHQAEAIRREIAECPYPVILCGDFNDVPVSYAYRTASRGLHDTFSRGGHMYAHTYRGFFDALRIDYIFVSTRFETLSYDVIPTGDISDHYPVIARIKQTSKQ
ncbi:MAG: endonuclease/exonuclease/phosphatase family protein [Alistipes sp.]|nr:endonuclease/exonuclease/phosphatase family protein [Alistipes sp.]